MVIKSIIFDIGGVVVFKNSPVAKEQKANRVLIRFLEKIKKRYVLYSLSNIDKEHHKENKRKKIYEVFKKSYSSYLTGIEKPEKKAFQMVLKENNLKPEETLLVDDKPSCIRAAKKVGMKTLLFKTNKQLFKQLFEMGVK